MPIVTEKWSERPFTRTTTGYEAEKIFEVSGVGDDRQAAINAVPYTLGASHPESALLKVNRIGADTPQGPLLWEVRVGFSTDTANGATGDDPLLWKTRWRWVPSTETVPTDRDIYDNVRTNSAGVPFEQQAQQFNGVMNLQATRNEPFYDAEKALFIQNKTNPVAFSVQAGSGFKIVQPGQAMVVNMLCENDVTADSPYATVTYNIKFKGGNLIPGREEYDSFFDVRLDVGDSGLMYLDGGTIGFGLFCNKDGMIVGNTLLDGFGRPLDEEVVIMSLAPDGTQTIGIPLMTNYVPDEAFIMDYTDRVYIAYRQYGQYDISDLSL